MIFAILFILAFLFGFGLYSFTRQWVFTVALSVFLFSISAFFDQSANSNSLSFTLLFGIPIVFFASLLGCYVVQIRSPDYLSEHEITQEPESKPD